MEIMQKLLLPTGHSNDNSQQDTTNFKWRADLLADINMVILSAWAPSTSAKYDRAVASFMQFCDANGVPSHLRLPASEFLLCAFTASHLRRTAGSTARNNLSGIHAWHIANNMSYAGHNSLRLSYTLKGVENLRPKGRPTACDMESPANAVLHAKFQFSTGCRCSGMRYISDVGAMPDGRIAFPNSEKFHPISGSFMVRLATSEHSSRI
jgi:hypothetical protein